MLTLSEAQRIADESLRHGRDLSLPPLAVVILDSGGHVQVVLREDGATFFRSTVASGKAWGALAMGASSRALGERLGDRPSFLGALSDLADGRMVPVAGGVLIYRGHLLEGAIGISGASSDEDEACAFSGIAAAGLTSVPA